MYCSFLHKVVKGVKRMNDMTTLSIRLSKEDKALLMRFAIERDLSASQIIRQMIRKYVQHCYIETY
ncbi:MAG: ribbon-helix-helix protein, CopG family [Clostridiales bacterium]|nr:ribbon-helix-helix protein, CopG family [Clostridiales bacterium]